MSVEAISWVLNEAPGVPPSLVSTLIGIANHAAPDGRHSYPSQPTLSRYTRKSERQVRRDLAELVRLKLIRKGDQRIVEHLPPDRRPVVYDLAMDLDGRTSTSPRSSTSARSPVSERGDMGDRTGGTSTSAKPSYEPSRTVRPPSARARKAETRPPAEPPRPDGLTEIPGDFKPTDTMRRWAVGTYGAAIDVEYETAQFISHYRSTGARRKSWPDAWQKWVRESAERRTRPRPGATVVPIDRRQQATNDLFERAMQRAIAREEQQ